MVNRKIRYRVIIVLSVEQNVDDGEPGKGVYDLKAPHFTENSRGKQRKNNLR